MIKTIWQKSMQISVKPNIFRLRRNWGKSERRSRQRSFRRDWSQNGIQFPDCI
jgi:hypothetical protein